MSKAQEVLVGYLIEMLKEVFITNEKSEMSFIHIEEKLKELTKTEGSSSTKKTKKPRNVVKNILDKRCKKNLPWMYKWPKSPTILKTLITYSDK